ncbi:extracellular solute-binding protein [Paenibacillus sp. JTLBN-2024]
MNKKGEVGAGAAGRRDAFLLSACTSGKKETAEESGAPGKPPEAKTETAIDPFRLPELVEVSTIKAVSPNERIPQGDTIEDNMYTRHFTEKTNVKFKYMWYASGDDYTQKLKLAVASNDLPDAMVVDERTFLELADADQLEDLTDVFQTYASDQVRANL